MVTAAPAVPRLVGVKNGVWPVVPVEVVDSVRVSAVPVLVTGLPNWSWTWTANGPTVAVALTVWLPGAVEVKASFLAAPPDGDPLV